MAKKLEPTAAPAGTELPSTGGSYLASESAGFVRQVDPPAAAAPTRRGFGSPQSGIPATQSAGKPEASTPAALPAPASSKE
jgi:hypothetical protein